MFRSLRDILNFKVLLAGVLFGLGMLILLVVVLYSAKSNHITAAPATAVLKIIPAPTQTLPGMVVTSTPTLSPIAVQPTPTPSGDILLGSYVQVSGTGGDGLRLHAEASVTSKVNYIAIDSEVFLVQDGPTNADGYIWWKLEDPFNNKTIGWGVANYLSVVPNP
jgi:hypothetical protein